MRGGWTGRAQRIFRPVKLFHVIETILYNGDAYHYTSVETLRMCNTREDPQYKLWIWIIRMLPCLLFIVPNAPLWWEGLDVVEVVCVWCLGIHSQFQVLFPANTKMVWKIKSTTKLREVKDFCCCRYFCIKHKMSVEYRRLTIFLKNYGQQSH